MNKSSTVFLQAFVVFVGIGALAVLLWGPHVEGRNAHATLFEIYFNDPFLAYAYVASIPFFVALYQAFTVFGYASQNKVFSHSAVNALRMIKYCGLAIIGFVAIGEIFIAMCGDKDDRPAGLFMGALLTCGAIAIATAAAKFERMLRNTVEMRKE